MSAGSSGCVLEMWVSRGKISTEGVTAKRVKKGKGGGCLGLSPPLCKDAHFACLTEVQN